MSKIKTLREAKDMTQAEMASILGVKRNTVAMWETDNALPRASLLPQIADLLGCTIDELFGRGGSPSDENKAVTSSRP